MYLNILLYCVVLCATFTITLSSEPDEFDKMVDASTEYVVVPNRGLLFQRTGTIFSHPQMNLMMAVITRARTT